MTKILTLFLVAFGIGLFTAPVSAAVCSVLDGAEQQFQPADPAWFHHTRSQLKREADRVNAGLILSGQANETYWKTLFHWDLLEKNTQSGARVTLSELELVRRWMFSNRKGTETEFFAPLRRTIDTHLDAAFTFSHVDLKASFLEHVSLARKQCAEFSQRPSDENAVKFGRTLGWFERTRQLSSVVAQLRSAFSNANAVLMISDSLINRVVSQQTDAVSQVTPVNQSLTLPAGLFGRDVSTRVRGTARTDGQVHLRLVPNASVAELQLRFEGTLHSTTRGSQGPVSTESNTSGPIAAQKSLYLTGAGLKFGQTQAYANVQPQVTGIEAPSAFVGRIAQRRLNRPEVQSAMLRQAKDQASSQLASQFSQQVEAQFAASQDSARRFQEKLKGFEEILAPIAREGAVPHFHSSATTADSIRLHFMAQTTLQFGAVEACPTNAMKADLIQCVHQSFFNNSFETIMGGKTYTDDYFMEGAKVLQAELPLALMIHSRAPRWSLTVRKLRPLVVSFNSIDDIQIQLHPTQLTIAGESWNGEAQVAVDYSLVKNDLGEYRLERKGAVTISGGVEGKFLSLLTAKMDAFFAPVLDGAGVIVPDGGVLGTLKGIQSKGVYVRNGWVVIGSDVPDETLKEIQSFQKKQP